MNTFTYKGSHKRWVGFRQWLANRIQWSFFEKVSERMKAGEHFYSRDQQEHTASWRDRTTTLITKDGDLYTLQNAEQCTLFRDAWLENKVTDPPQAQDTAGRKEPLQYCARSGSDARAKNIQLASKLYWTDLEVDELLATLAQKEVLTVAMTTTGVL